MNEDVPHILCSRYFLEHQGYPASDSIVYQDNQSTILLEKNGRASSGKRTRHINIRYIFVTDRMAAKEMRVEYYPTGEMLADFFTKPLQGTPFRKVRDIIMNLPQPTHALPEPRTMLKHDGGSTGEVFTMLCNSKQERCDEGWTMVIVHKRHKAHSIGRKCATNTSINQTCVKRPQTVTNDRIVIQNHAHRENTTLANTFRHNKRRTSTWRRV